MSRRVISMFSLKRRSTANKPAPEWEYMCVMTLEQRNSHGNSYFGCYDVKCVENQGSENFHVFTIISSSTGRYTKQSTHPPSQETTLAIYPQLGRQISELGKISVERTRDQGVQFTTNTQRRRKPSTVQSLASQGESFFYEREVEVRRMGRDMRETE